MPDVLLKMPRAMILPQDVAFQVMNLLSTHIDSAVTIGWDGELKYLSPKDKADALSLHILPVALLAVTVMSE